MNKFLYEFHLDDGEVYSFEIDLRRERPGTASGIPLTAYDDLPEWTLLEYHQCANCPLNQKAHPRCPAAVAIEHIAQRFSTLISHRTARVIVKSEERSYERVCAVQDGLRSVLGLLMAGSGCPILSKFKPMAHFHLPFSSTEETLFRTVGTYLLRQYFNQRRGLPPDWELEGLKQHYTDLETVNSGLMKRLGDASEMDANLNAVNNFFSLASVMSLALEDLLQELEPFFRTGPGERRG